MASIYDFTLPDAQGNEVALSDYKGKVLLIVNTATRCGLTPQYEELQSFYAQYAPQGLETLDFPCNQFREQAPESSEEIAQVCQMKFGTKFKIFRQNRCQRRTRQPALHLSESATARRQRRPEIQRFPAQIGLAGRKARRQRHQMEFHQISGQPRRRSGETLCPQRVARRACRRYRSAAVSWRQAYRRPV